MSSGAVAMARVEEVDGIVEVAALARDAGKRLDEAQIGLQRECASERVARIRHVAEVEQHRSKIAPREHVVGLRPDRAADRVDGLGEPAAVRSALPRLFQARA